MTASIPQVKSTDFYGKGYEIQEEAAGSNIPSAMQYDKHSLMTTADVIVNQRRLASLPHKHIANGP